MTFDDINKLDAYDKRKLTVDQIKTISITDLILVINNSELSSFSPQVNAYIVECLNATKKLLDEAIASDNLASEIKKINDKHK